VSEFSFYNDRIAANQIRERVQQASRTRRPTRHRWTAFRSVPRTS
jgi:hypothetical protein